MLHYTLDDFASDLRADGPEEKSTTAVEERAVNEILLVRGVGLLEDTLAARTLAARLADDSSSAGGEEQITSAVKAEIGTMIRELEGLSGPANDPEGPSSSPEEDASDKYSSWAIQADDVDNGDAADEDDDEDDYGDGGTDDDDGSGACSGGIGGAPMKRSDQRYLNRLLSAANAVAAAESEAEYVAAVLTAMATVGVDKPDARHRNAKSEKKKKKKKHMKSVDGSGDCGEGGSADPFSQSFGEIMAGLFPGIAPPASPPPAPPQRAADDARGSGTADAEETASEDGETDDDAAMLPRQQEGPSSIVAPTTTSLRVPIAVVAAFHASPARQDAAPGLSSGGILEVRDVSEHQSVRDVERDTLLVNDELLSGAALGYDGVVARLVAVERTLLPASMQEPLAQGPGGSGGGGDGPFDSLGDHASSTAPQLSSAIPRPSLRFQDLSRQLHSRSQLESFAKMVLRAVNRTESGHWSFALVAALCANKRCVEIVPDSSAAGPLIVNITSGPVRISNPSSSTPRTTPGVMPSLFGGALGGPPPKTRDAAGSAMGWGLRAEVEASTVYNFYDHDMSRVILRVKSRFAHRLAMPLNVGSPQHLARLGVAWERLGAAGEVTLEALQVPGLV